jgi:hypothetical protein
MLKRDEPTGRSPALWPLALLGLFLVVFAVAALSAPGRMDIIDAQPRYEVARSLVEHGDPAIRDPDLWFCVLPGRDGQRYTLYRLPQSLLGVPAILLADATGPVSEERREFFFSLTSPFTGALLAVAYALWFRRLGYSTAAALAWALAGIFCTPSWFYSTSTFDDILGTTAVVWALMLAWQGREQRPQRETRAYSRSVSRNDSDRTSRPCLFAALAGLAIGVAFNCKQPLGLFFLPVLVLVVESPGLWRPRLLRAGLALAGLAAGLLVYSGYEWYKFPPGSTEGHAEILARYIPAWPGTPVAAAGALVLSPGAGMFFYCPTLVLALAGLGAGWRAHRAFTVALVLACAGFIAFICSLNFFKGDPAWGPRYLTPIFAVFWVFVPAAAAVRPRPLVGLILGLGVVVQLLALSVDHYRLYVELRFPSAFFQGRPWIYYYPGASQLSNRPREIVEILTDDQSATTVFGPMQRPTEGTPCLEFMDRGPQAVRKYRFLSSFRPWWASQCWLPPDQRPVALGPTGLLLAGFAFAGVLLMISPFWPRRSPHRALPADCPLLRGVPCP